MRKLLCLTILSLTGSLLFLQPLAAANSQPAEELSQRFRDLHPRTEASDGEARAFEIIAERLSELGLEPETRGFDDFENGYSFSSIVTARIPGDSDEDLIIAVPVDHSRRRGPADDGAAGLALVLAFAERYAEQPPPVNLKFLFLGAENGPFDRHPMGTRHYLRGFFPERPTAVIYLDLQQAGGTLEMEHGGEGVVAPSWLVEAGLRGAHAAGLAYSFPGTLGHLYRAGVRDAHTPVAHYLEAELPAIALYNRAHQTTGPAATSPETADRAGTVSARERAGGAAASNPEEWFEQMSLLLERITERAAGNVGAQWDRHYAVFELPGEHIVLPETAHILVVWLIAAAMLMYGMAFRNRLTRYLRTVWRNLWSLPVLFILIFGFLALATLLLEQILELRGFPSLWQFHPLPFFVMKLTLAIFLFATVFQLAFRLPFSKHGSFYSASAIVVLMVLVVVMAGISISFSYYFLWALLCAFMFSITRRKTLMPLWLILAPLWFLVAAYVIFSRPELGAISTLLLSPLRGNAILALILLPFLLMLVRIDFLLSPPSPGKALFSLRLLSAVTGVVSVAFIAFVVVINPFDNEHRQPVEVREQLDHETKERLIEFRSPAPLPSLEFVLGDERYQIETAARQYSLQPEGLPELVDTAVFQQEFLDRIQTRLTLEPHQPFGDLTIRLSAPESFLLFDSNFPFRMGADGRSAEIFVGTAPPIPVEVEYTVPAGIPIEARLRAEWFDLAEPFRLANADLILHPNLRLSQPVFVPE